MNRCSTGYRVWYVPVPPVVAKVMAYIDDVSRAIIEKSPFIVLASATADGYPDISPKGDPAGFVKVINKNLLAIPDRPGNKRLDTFTNILLNPYLAIIFLIPGKGETLRVAGESRIVRDQALRESMAVNGRVPEFAIVLHVERVLIHCPKCVVRSKLWEPKEWPDSSDTAGIAEAIELGGSNPLNAIFGGRKRLLRTVSAGYLVAE